MATYRHVVYHGGGKILTTYVRRSARQGPHPDVEFAVDDASGKERIFKDPVEAQLFALNMAMSRGESAIDVLIWSEDGAQAYGGSDAVDRYNEDPEASVFERYEISVNFVGMVP